MKIITQNNLLTNSKWWQAIDNHDNVIHLMHINENAEEIVLLEVARFDNEEIANALNEAIMKAISYESDGMKQFSVPDWEKENIS